MRLADVFVAVRADMTDVNQAFRGLESSLGGVQKSLGDMGRTLTTSVTLPILAVGGATSKMALDFERTMGQLVGLADIPAASIDGISESILNLSREVGRGPQELADAFYFVASAGFEAEEAMELLEVAARGSAAGMGETQDIAKVLGGIINAYGRENIDAAQAVDILTAAVTEGTAEASSFANVLPQVVPTAAQLGVEFEEVAGAIAAITTTGSSAEMAAVGLNQVFTNLLKPSAKAKGALADVGLTLEELRTQLAEEGIISVLRTLEERFGGNVEAMGEVFGNVRSLRAAFSLLNLDAAQIDEIMGNVANSTGAAGDAFDAIPPDVLAMDRAIADMQATAIELGRDVLPVVADIFTKVAAALRDGLTWWKSLSDETQNTIINSALLAAALGPVLLILGKLVGVLKFAVVGVKGLVVAGKLLRTAWLNIPTVLGYLDLALLKARDGIAALVRIAPTVGAAMHAMLGPIGIVTGAIAALGVVWATDLGGIQRNTEITNDIIALHFGDLGDRANELADRFGTSFDDIKKRVREHMEETGSSVEQALAAIEHELRGPMNDALLESEQRWEDYQESISGAAESTAGRVVEEYTDMNGDLVTVFEDGSTAVNGEFGAMTEEMIEAARVAREAAVEQMAFMLEGMASLFENDEQVQKAFQDLLDRMDDPYTEAERKADIFSQDLLTVIKTALDSDDPGAVAATTELVNRLLREFELIEPGALESGTAVPPAIEAGMDQELQDLIDWIQENVTGEALSALTLDEAKQIGIDGIFLYNEGMLSQERAAGTAAQRVADSAKQGAGAIDFTETGETNAGELITGMGSRGNDLRLAGIFAAQDARGGFDGESFYGSGAAAIAEMVLGINDNAWKLQSAAYNAASQWTDVFPSSEPKDPRSPFRGITTLGGRMIRMIADDVFANLGIGKRAGLAMAGAFVPTFGTASVPRFSAEMATPVGTSAVGVGNTYQVYVNDLPQHPTLAEIGGELKRLGDMGKLPGGRE